MNKIYNFILFVFVSVSFLYADDSKVTMRVGYFPNITHSQAIIGMAKGTFKEKLGENVTIDAKIFNAGPSAIEAMFAGDLDLSYIGPNPAINGYIKSKGEALQIVAGATSGGASFIIRNDLNITKPEDFSGKKIASPQLGNTQDVALRGWLKAHGMKLKEKGGDVQVLPIPNPDQLTLFLKKEIDGAWAVEPWASRLIQEGNGKLYIDEKTLWPNGEFVTANIIVSKKFLNEHKDLVKKWLKAHVEITNWINANIPQTKTMLNEEIKKMTTKALPVAVLDASFSNIKVTYDPIKSSLFTSAQNAFDEGFLGKEKPDLSGIYNLTTLNEVLKESKLKEIK